MGQRQGTFCNCTRHLKSSSSALIYSPGANSCIFCVCTRNPAADRATSQSSCLYCSLAVSEHNSHRRRRGSFIFALLRSSPSPFSCCSVPCARRRYPSRLDSTSWSLVQRGELSSCLCVTAWLSFVPEGQISEHAPPGEFSCTQRFPLGALFDQKKKKSTHLPGC